MGICALLVSCAKVDKDPKVIVITFDGLRWQEVFTGADSLLISDPGFSRDPDALRAEYWRATPEARRQVLMPYTWSHIASHGYLLGNRYKNSLMQVSNNKSFSYPGYSEMFCGWADDERVESNDPVPNPNTSVMEVVNQDPRYKGHVMVYGSWSSIRFAVNNDKGGFPGSTAFEPNVSPNPSPTLKALDLLQESIWGKGGDERPDGMTYAYAIETIRNDHPKLFFISFGETDEWGHGGQYDKYLHIVTHTDSFIKDIIETCEADPFYRGKTTYLLTTDHGRETDSQLALDLLTVKKEAFSVLSGGFGGRFDHAFSLLYAFAGTKLHGCIADDYEFLLFLHDEDTVTLQLTETPKSISLLPLSSFCNDVTIDGVYWPLTGATLRQNEPYAISNRLSSHDNRVTVKNGNGTLTLYLCRDETSLL